MIPLRHLATVTNSNVDKLSDPAEIPVRLCNYVDVYKNERITNDMAFMSATATPSEIARFGLRIGDVIITKDSEDRNDIAVPAYVSETAPDIVCGYHLALLRARSALVQGSFLFWAIQSKQAREAFSNAAGGVTRFGLTLDGMKSVPLPLPDRDTQKAIADFLDRETARIDQMIKKKKRQVELLLQRSSIEIFNLLTTGTENFSMRNCHDIEWIGRIPSHWNIMKTKYLFDLRCKPAPKSNNMELLSVYTDIGVRPRRTLEQKGNKASTTDGYWIVKEGDIIVNKLLAWMGAVGFSAYDGVTSPAYDVLRPKRCANSKYYHYLFRSKQVKQEFRKYSYGIMGSSLFHVGSRISSLPAMR